jgi:two-component system NtrC family sensor kinase
VQFVGESVELLRHAFASLRGMNARFRAALESVGTEAMKRAITDAEASVSLTTIETDIAESLDRMLEGTSRITTIVRAMKEFMHPVQREKAPADLNRALLNTLTVARNEYKYVARLETDLAPDLPLVHCHVGDLNQVFLNLIVNAAHAIADVVARTRALGRIVVRSRRDGDHVIFELNDSGTGIPLEARDRIFEPFFTTKEVGKGTGQGLAIVRAIVVDRHKGSVTFETELGRGTTFRVRLPIGPPS